MNLALVLTFATALLPQGAPAQSSSIAAAMRAIAARPPFAHAIVAAEVYDLDARRPLYVRNPDVLMEAASTTKLLTTGTSLALLGRLSAGRRRSIAPGPSIRAGCCTAISCSSRAPTPTSRNACAPTARSPSRRNHSYDGNYNASAPGDPLAVLRTSPRKSRGRRRANRRSVSSTSLLDDPGQGRTRAIVSSIVVNDNLVHRTLRRDEAGDPSQSPRPTPYVTFVNADDSAPNRADDRSPEDTTNPDRSHTVTITGALPRDGVLFRTACRTAALRAAAFICPARCRRNGEYAVRRGVRNHDAVAPSPPQTSSRVTYRRHSPKTSTSRSR